MDRFSAHLDRAWQLVSKGDAGRAMLAARQALGIDDESPEVHNLLGCIYAMEGDFGEALSCYQRAIDLDEDYLDPLLNSAELLIHSHGNPENAIDFCHQARELVELEDELVEVVLLETDALLSLGRIEDARNMLREIENREFEEAVHFMLVGRALFEIGDFEKSKVLIERSLALDPESPDAWYCRGLLHREEGRRVDAASAFAKVLSADSLRTPSSWQKSVPSMEDLVRKAISLLDEETREMLKGAEVHIAPLPSPEQVAKELDPRQAVWAEDVDTEKRAFRHLWIFYFNFDNAGVLALSPESDLSERIRDELLLGAR